ncbi:MAG: hypothetical protein HQK79_14205 [Desulfobacterales bacterium]|nr:hypothetical protein [Desulfobacterales bacterium]
MATTITRTDQFITITGIDADVLPGTLSRGSDQSLKIKRIEFVAGNANDKIVIKQGTDTGATICQLGSSQASEPDRIDFGDGCRCKPYIDLSDCTLNNNHKLNIELA